MRLNTSNQRYLKLIKKINFGGLKSIFFISSLLYFFIYFFDNFDQILMKRASITGFFCPDFLEDGPKIEKIMHDWYLEGSLKFKADVTNGLENVLVSYKRMFNGDNIGKTLVRL